MNLKTFAVAAFLALVSAIFGPALAAPPVLVSGVNLPYLLLDPSTDSAFTPTVVNGDVEITVNNQTVTLSSSITQLKKHGVKHVRLPIGASGFLPLPASDNGAGNYAQLRDATYLKAVDAVLKELVNSGLLVVVNMRFTAAEQSNFVYLPQSYGQMWGAFATHVAQEYGPTKVIFELANEPRLCGSACTADYDPIDVANARWSLIQNIWLKAVRTAAPNHTIVLTADGGSDFNYLLRLPLVSDANVIYTFHYYYPFIFTYQGASWVPLPDFALLPKASNGLLYTPTSSNCSVIEADCKASPSKCGGSASSAAAIVASVVDYCTNWPNKSRIGTDFAAIQNWATSHKVAVWAGEWGAFPGGGMSNQSFINYLTDMSATFKDFGIGSAAWEYYLWLSQLTNEPIAKAAGFP